MQSIKSVTNLIYGVPKAAKFLRTIASRQLSVSCTKYGSFNVQDQEDFEDRVLKSETPIIVDFHAK